VAANVTTNKLPKWLPYVAAALAAVLLDWLLGFVKCCLIMRPLLSALGDAPAAWPGLTMPLLQGMWLHVPRSIELCLLTALGFMYFREARKRTEALRKVQLERVRVARQTYESRLQTMQARVEPQFLFDTLNEVERLYESQPRVAEQMLDDLIVYLRAALPSLRERSSTLATELNLVRAWLDIMKIRLQRQLSYAITIPEDPQRVRMPPMVLLPLIDHATQAARSSSPYGRSIQVDAALDDGRLCITISTAGEAFAPDTVQNVASQVRERLVALYSAEASLVFRNTRTGETQAIVEVPLEHAESDHR
jgi:LytS/YehU family sensor histidine kinase